MEIEPKEVPVYVIGDSSKDGVKMHVVTIDGTTTRESILCEVLQTLKIEFSEHDLENLYFTMSGFGNNILDEVSLEIIVFFRIPGLYLKIQRKIFK